MIEKNGKMSELLKEQVCDIENCLILTKKSQSIFPFSSKRNFGQKYDLGKFSQMETFRIIFQIIKISPTIASTAGIFFF